MERIKPVQIIGTQRSGSNLLRLMLNQINGVFAPHPPHILSVFYPLLTAYGDLSIQDNFKSLIDDVCSLVELNPVPWENARLDRDEILEMSEKGSLIEIFKNVYESSARRNNANVWICKSMQNVRYIPQYLKIGIAPKLIYLYRDGRDVALSFKKAIVGPKHIYSIAEKWQEEQRLALEIVETMNQFDSLSVSYESLVLDPEKEMLRICKFLGINYSSSVLNFYTSMESRKTAEAGEMWSNVAHPIIKKNIGKYKTELSYEELGLFEHVAGDTLLKMGYSLSLPISNKPMHFSNSEIESIHKQNIHLMDLVRKNANDIDIKKRAAQNDFILKLKTRLKIAAA